jgi:hypothetical protein
LGYDLQSTVKLKISKPASCVTGAKKYGRFRGVAGFAILPLERIVKHGLKKSANIQGRPVI